MKQSLPTVAIGLAIAFIAGFSTHFLYKRWNVPADQLGSASFLQPESPNVAFEAQNHTVTFDPHAPGAASTRELPLLQARDVGGLRGITGQQARIRGRVFRVGHSGKSNTYFLNFGPSREALTAVIFASAVELFEEGKLAPKSLEGKEVEIQGMVKDHPQYGLEVILETPSQIKIVN
ncbi:MAG: hypothetical protein ACREQV_24525 [Candidatus Binatia bacterium]